MKKTITSLSLITASILLIGCGSGGSSSSSDSSNLTDSSNSPTTTNTTPTINRVVGKGYYVDSALCSRGG